MSRIKTTFRYPLNTVACHGCGEHLSAIRGCPDRIEICRECRKIPPRLEKAHAAMNMHMFFAHGLKS